MTLKSDPGNFFEDFVVGDELIHATPRTVTCRLPTGRVPTARTAFPVASSGAVPSEEVPSNSSTDPVGIPVSGATALTVAVNVTAWPVTVGPGGVADKTIELTFSTAITICVGW